MSAEMARAPMLPTQVEPQNEEEAAAAAAEEEARKKAARAHIRVHPRAVASSGKADGWRDPDFPAGDWAIDPAAGADLAQRFSGAVAWVQPAAVCATSKPPGLRADGAEGGTWLWDDPREPGVKAGAISRREAAGEHYLATAAVLAVRHDPLLADDLIDAEFERRGAYGVALHRPGGALSLVWVDALLPATGGPRRSALLMGTGERNPTDVWPCIVEKAIAKTAGSYVAVAGPSEGMAAALKILLGPAVETSTVTNGAAAWRTIDAALSRQGGVWRGGGRGGPLLLLCSHARFPGAQHQFVPAATTFAVVDTDTKQQLVLLAGALGRASDGPGTNPRAPPEDDPTAFWLRAEELPALFDSLHVVSRRVSADAVARGEALRERFAGQPQAIKPGLALRDEHRKADHGARAAAAKLLEEEEARGRRRTSGKDKDKTKGRKNGRK
jgi:hypothetical protein